MKAGDIEHGDVLLGAVRLTLGDSVDPVLVTLTLSKLLVLSTPLLCAVSDRPIYTVGDRVRV